MCVQPIVVREADDRLASDIMVSQMHSDTLAVPVVRKSGQNLHDQSRRYSSLALTLVMFEPAALVSFNAIKL